MYIRISFCSGVRCLSTNLEHTFFMLKLLCKICQTVSLSVLINSASAQLSSYFIATPHIFVILNNSSINPLNGLCNKIITHAEESYWESVFEWVWSRNFVNEEALAHWGTVALPHLPPPKELLMITLICVVNYIIQTLIGQMIHIFMNIWGTVDQNLGHLKEF